MEFHDWELEELLEARRSDRKIDKKLRTGRKYMLQCSNCINPNDFSLQDEHGLLLRFEEVFYAIQNLVELFSPRLYNKIDEIETKLNLSQNVIKLGMIDGRLNSPPVGKLSKILSPPPHKLELPKKGEINLTSQLLLEIQTALTRIGGLCGTASREAKEWLYLDKDVFVVEGYYDPRNISKLHLKTLLIKVRNSLRTDLNISNNVVAKLQVELDEATRELDKDRPSWNKVVSKVSQTVIVLAAIVTIAANLDDAYQNAVKAIEYISQQAISVPKMPTEGAKKIPKLASIVHERKED